MAHIKYKLTHTLIVAFLFLTACNSGDVSGYWDSFVDCRYIHQRGWGKIIRVRKLVRI